MRYEVKRFAIDCPAWRLRIDIHGLVPVEQELTRQLESVARRSTSVEDLMRGLRAIADRSGLVAEVAGEPQWDGASLELRVGIATTVAA